MSGKTSNKIVPRVLHLLFVAFLIALDQVTKYIARYFWAAGNDLILIDKVFRFTFLKNTGAAWGSFSGKTVVLSIVSLLILCFVLYVYIRLPLDKRYLPLRILVLLVVAGAVGNLIDRFAFGYVTDFLYFELINFPVFNVADCYITVSCFLLVILLLTKYRNDELDFISLKKKEPENNAEK